MKALQITYHTLFALLGSFILIDQLLSKDLIYILSTILIVNGILIQLYSVFKQFYFKNFPLNILFLILYIYFCFSYFTNKPIFIDKVQLLSFLLISTTFLAYYFVLDSIFRISAGQINSTIKIISFRKYNRLNFLIISGLSGLFLSIYLLSSKKWNIASNYFFIVLIISYPFFNINYIKGFFLKVNQICLELGFDITFDQFGKLAGIKNFVFVKDKFISSENYKIIDSDFKSSVKVLTIMQLCYQLSNLWNKRYAKLFVLDDYEKDKLKFNIVENNDNGITVIDDDAVMYHFGNNSFVKDKVRKDETSNLFLVKNGLYLAKFKISERLEDLKTELINQLDYFGNTILFNPGMSEDLAKDYFIVFDKIYSGTNEKRQQELLKDLEKQEPTALFTVKDPGFFKNALTFYITSKIGLEKSTKLIKCGADNLQKVPNLIQFSKKLHTIFKYSLIFSAIFQTAILVLYFLYSLKPILILAFLLIIILLAEIISIYFKKKIDSTPQIHSS